MFGILQLDGMSYYCWQGIKAYKDPAVGQCYIERLDGSATESENKESRRRQFIVGQNFTKYEVNIVY